MQTQIELSEMFSYSFIPIIILEIILIIAILAFKFIKENEKVPQVIEPNKKDREAIKEKYLLKINNLIVEVSNNKINNRDAYQELSSLIRNFVYEMTTIKVQYYTLSDIEKINIPILYDLVNEYYDPEFSKESKGNLLQSIERTRKVIERWN